MKALTDKSLCFHDSITMTLKSLGHQKLSRSGFGGELLRSRFARQVIADSQRILSQFVDRQKRFSLIGAFLASDVHRFWLFRWGQRVCAMIVLVGVSAVGQDEPCVFERFIRQLLPA